MPSSKLCLTLFGALVSINSFSQNLKINLVKGQKYQVENNVKVATTSNIMGQSIESKNSEAHTTLYEVTDINSSSTKFISTITHLTIEADVMGKSSSYDSDRKDNDEEQTKIFEKIVNKPQSIEIDYEGKTISEAAKNDDANAIMVAIGKSGINSKLELIIPTLIGKKLTVGETYPAYTTSGEMKMTITDSGFYKVTAIENGVASIAYSGTQQLKGEIEQMGMTMDVSGGGNLIMEIKLDINSGIVITKTINSDINMKTEVMGMTVPNTVKTTSSITVSAIK